MAAMLSLLLLGALAVAAAGSGGADAQVREFLNKHNQTAGATHSNNWAVLVTLFAPLAHLAQQRLHGLTFISLA